MNSLAEMGRVVLSLGGVLLLMWVLARFTKRGKRRSDGLVTVLGRQSLSRSTSVAVVQVADRMLVIGVTDHGISLLSETTPDTTSAEAASTLADVTQPVRFNPVPPATANRSVNARSTRDDRPVQAARTSQQNGALTGSVLSPRTWTQTVDALRDLTTR